MRRKLTFVSSKFKNIGTVVHLPFPSVTLPLMSPNIPARHTFTIYKFDSLMNYMPDGNAFDYVKITSPNLLVYSLSGLKTSQLVLIQCNIARIEPGVFDKVFLTICRYEYYI